MTLRLQVNEADIESCIIISNFSCLLTLQVENMLTSSIYTTAFLLPAFLELTVGVCVLLHVQYAM